MSDSEQEYDPAASTDAVPSLQQENENEINSSISPEAEPKEIEPSSSSNQPEQPSAVEDHQSDKSDAESEYNPEVPETEPPKAAQQEEEEKKQEVEDDNNDEDEDDYDPEALLSDKESTAPRTLEEAAAPASVEPQSASPTPQSQEVHTESAPPQPIPENDAPLSKNEKIQQFNSIITHFMSTPYLNDPTFQSLTPDQKSMVVLADYNKAKGTNIKTPINFHATTSFNKLYLKRNETAFPMVPVNPFCKRPDITAPNSYDFQQSYNDFITEEAKWLRTGRVETLPSGSRLFIGNLPVNTITKEDCYKLFRPYGEIVQISIKPGYGFIQFATAEGCNDALEGETNVPLHGKMLQLEISKTQIRQAQEYQEKQRRKQGQNDRDGPSTHDNGPYSRRGRSRSPSPSRDSYKRRSPQQSRASIADDNNTSECHIFQSNDTSPMFVRKLLKVLRKEGISFKIEQNVSDVESAGNDAAYAGAMAVVVINSDDLNVKTFEKTADGGIKFDEYTNISVEEADSILSASKAKRGGPSHGGHSQSSGNFDQKDFYNKNSHNNNRGGNSRSRGKDSRGDRGRGNGRGRGGFESGHGGYHNNNNNQYGGNNYPNYQPPVPQHQQVPPQQSAPAMDPTAIIAQLQNYDPNTIQQVLSLLGNQQQQQQLPQQSPPMPQQHYGGYQPPLPLPPQQYGGYNGIPPQQQYYQQPPPPPQQQQQQQYYQQPPQPPSQPQPPQPQPPQQQQQGGSSGSSLLEALARLKKNS